MSFNVNPAPVGTVVSAVVTPPPVATVTTTPVFTLPAAPLGYSWTFWIVALAVVWFFFLRKRR